MKLYKCFFHATVTATPLPTPIECPPGTLLCVYERSNGSAVYECIDGEVCNGIKECSDGSDEFGCQGKKGA